MQSQLGTKTLLLAVAAIAITLAAWVMLAHRLEPMQWNLFHEWIFVAAMMPYWWPLVFLAYVIGRRRLTVPAVVLLAIGEFVAVAIYLGLPSLLKD